MEQLSNGNFNTSLSGDEQKIIIAASGKHNRISNLKKEQISDCLTDIITRALIDTGQSKNDSEFIIFKETFTEELRSKNKFSQLTMEEVSLAFYNGIRKEYGEFFGINNATAYMFVDKYIESEKRKSALTKQSKYEAAMETKPIDEATKVRIYFDGALKKFNDYKRTRTFNDAGSVTFKFLWVLGLLNLSKEEIHNLKLIAQEKLIKEQQVRRVNGGIKHDIDKTITLLQDISNIEVVSMAKKIALENYFSCLLESNIELETELKKATTTKQ